MKFSSLVSIQLVNHIVVICITAMFFSSCKKDGNIDEPGNESLSAVVASNITPGSAKVSILGGFVSASTSQPGNVPANVVDGNVSTRWSADGNPQAITFDLDANYTLDFVKISFYVGGQPARSYNFDIAVSMDNVNWTTVASNLTSAANSSALQTFDFTDAPGMYVRITGHGNNESLANSYTEVEVWGIPFGTVGVISDYETGDRSQWQGVKCFSEADQFGIVSNIKRQGNYSAYFRVRPGDKYATTSGERCELFHSIPQNGYVAEKVNDDYYYGWSTYFPTTWTMPAGWGIFMQWHHRNYANPPIAFNVGSNGMSVIFSTGFTSYSPTRTYTHSRSYIIEAQTTTGLWHDFMVHVKWRPDSTGVFEVRHRLQGDHEFTTVINLVNIPTMQYQQTTQNIEPNYIVPFGAYYTSDIYVQHGLYRGDGGTNTNLLFQDNWCRGSLFSAIRSRFL